MLYILGGNIRNYVRMLVYKSHFDKLFNNLKAHVPLSLYFFRKLYNLTLRFEIDVIQEPLHTMRQNDSLALVPHLPLSKFICRFHKGLV